MRRAAAALGCVLTLLAARVRAAEPAPEAEAGRARSRIAIVSAGGDPFGMRLAAELDQLGFDVALVAPGAEAASRASLEAAARGAGAIAAVRMVPSSGGVEVWIADRVTGKTLLRELAADDGDDGGAALALRTVELLRASLLEMALPEAPAGEVPATAELADKLDVPAPGALAQPSAAAPERPPAAVRFALEPGLLVSAGGLGPAPTLGVGAEWRWSDGGGLSAFAAAPLASARAARAEGTTELAVWMVGAALHFPLAEPHRAWQPSIDAGALVLGFQSRADAERGFLARAESAWTGAPFVRAGLARAVSPVFRLRADIVASALAQAVSIRVSEHEAASWGQPMILFAAGADAGWF